MESKEERNAYQRGYSAGKRKTKEQQDKQLGELQEAQLLYQKITARSTQRRDAFFCAALTGLLANGSWKIGENKDLSTQVRIAHMFADASMKEMS